MTTKAVYLEREGAIARITLNQPERFNAMNEAMWMCLGDLMTECDEDTDLHASLSAAPVVRPLVQAQTFKSLRPRVGQGVGHELCHVNDSWVPLNYGLPTPCRCANRWSLCWWRTGGRFLL